MPIENAAMPDRTVIQWDKNDLDELGILKVDCLSLGMLTAIRKCFAFVHGDGPMHTIHDHQLTLAAVPAEDPGRVRHDLPGRHARRLPDRKPGADEHAAATQPRSVLRPGDRSGDRPARPDPGEDGASLSAAPNGEGAGHVSERRDPRRAHKTLGVPLFQEQAMRLAVVAAGFTPGEADQLRRAMGAWRRPGIIEKFRQSCSPG